MPFQSLFFTPLDLCENKHIKNYEHFHESYLKLGANYQLLLANFSETVAENNILLEVRKVTIINTIAWKPYQHDSI